MNQDRVCRRLLGMKQTNPLPFARRLAALLSGAALTLSLAACIVTTTPPPAGPPAAGNPGTVDCSQPPERMCCQSDAPECLSCQDQAAAEQAAWDDACSPAASPAPPTVDCSEPPGRMCCGALTAECQSCQDQAEAEQAEWEATCGPVTAPGPAPAPPTVDCSEPPGRMCCQAETAACLDCKQQAAAEQEAWESQCGQ
ncbi:hypothetical protein [Haliangium sp.]|uniref:hypothetical protein n=2 Tax=Haliangium sp. TaxID=2663208 RepID=UPI003D0A3508